jgi:hypothetical protein
MLPDFVSTDFSTLLHSFGTQLAPGGFAVFSDFAKAAFRRRRSPTSC